jgi:hydroxymethylglutaryl-CoA reductase (NADPH)
LIPEEPFEYTQVPGRGLLTKNAIKARIDYLIENGFELEHITRYFLDYASIRNNIESFIGTVEIPLGIVGPLLFNDAGHSEFVYTAAGTLEGALIASMNRGAKAISMSGGFTAKVMGQKMLRAPLFILESHADALVFETWVNAKFPEIKETASRYSNHANLISLSTHVIGSHVHIRFVYTTEDASGQNMTTTCTWHAGLWMTAQFTKETGIPIPNYVIEGNGSSDKKASRFMIDHGRGIHVEAECFLDEHTIKKVLRTSSEDIFRCYGSSVELAKQDGMLGFNINVANAVASIFAATGQDLASIHESSIGILHLELKEGGLALKLTLPSLVIGTVGGGTGLEKQNEGLKIMKCDGSGKVRRFAKLIAGFALGLEISTYSAIVSGEFAKAHETLGRNKPSNRLLKNELNEAFVKKCLNNTLKGQAIKSAEVLNTLSVENGILTLLTGRVVKKLIGFIPVRIGFENDDTKNILIKSKASDLDTIKGLHAMAASVDPQLSDLLYVYRENLEYWNCHYKELNIYEYLSENGFTILPEFYGNYINDDREIFLLFHEYMDKSEMLLMDSENSPLLWTKDKIETVIDAIHSVHAWFADVTIQNEFPEIEPFRPWKSIPLYKKMADIIAAESEQSDFSYLYTYIDELEDLYVDLELPLTLIHNDFNPRNVALRKNGLPCIYDWELAVKTIPHRDIVEFLCFALPLNFEESDFMHFLDYHYRQAVITYPEINRNKWFKGYIYSLKEFLVTRAAFYKVSEILMKLKFGDRIMQNAQRMIQILCEK